LILGDSEIEQGAVAAKDLEKGTQETWAMDSILSQLQNAEN
jgi:histidyl-tRNA synthetase